MPSRKRFSARIRYPRYDRHIFHSFAKRRDCSFRTAVAGKPGHFAGRSPPHEEAWGMF
jgi:hypothetical protein